MYVLIILIFSYHIHTSAVRLMSGLSSNSISQVDLCVPNLMCKYQLVFTLLIPVLIFNCMVTMSLYNLLEMLIMFVLYMGYTIGGSMLWIFYV